MNFKFRLLHFKFHIDYWIRSAIDDWRNVERMFKGRSYIPCLFFTHLVFEKLAKAIWVMNNQSNHPPRTHNILIVLQQANVTISSQELMFFELLNVFQIESRYPDYQSTLNQTTTRKIAKEILDEAAIHKANLLNLLSFNGI